jgi:hypothetical protein
VSETSGGFSQAFFSHAGRVSDKWQQYLAVYSSELDHLRAAGQPVRLLEIGVQNGGSLEVWENYLPAGSTILGLDVNPEVGQLSFASDRIAVKVVDATDRTALEDALGNRTFDVIVDDGSHLCQDVITTFDILFDHLAPCGKYFIEDLHTSYYPTYNGGYRRPGSSIEWLKSLADALNLDHIAPTEDIPPEELRYLSRRAKALAKISFYDSLCVIEKLAHEKLRPYRRIITGSAADISGFDEIVALTPFAQLLEATFVTPAARQIDPAVLAELAHHREQEMQLRHTTQQHEAIISSLQEALTRSQAECEQIRNEMLRAKEIAATPG